MRTLKQFGGSILVLLVAIVLAVCFFTDSLQDETTNKIVLSTCFVLVIVGVLLNIFGGKSADKIGGK